MARPKLPCNLDGRHDCKTSALQSAHMTATSRPERERKKDQLTIDSTAAAHKHPIPLHKPPRHPPCRLIPNPHSIIHTTLSHLKIARHPIHPNALHHAIDLLPPSRPLPLRLRKHNPMLDLIIQSAPLRIRQHNLRPAHSPLALEIQPDPADRASRPGPRHKRIKPPPSLPRNLRPGATVVRPPIGLVLELIGEEAAARAVWVGGVLGGEAARPVDEVVRVNDGGGGDAVDFGAKAGEESGFFGGLVGGEDASRKGSGLVCVVLEVKGGIQGSYMCAR